MRWSQPEITVNSDRTRTQWMHLRDDDRQIHATIRVTADTGVEWRCGIDDAWHPARNVAQARLLARSAVNERTSAR